MAGGSPSWQSAASVTVSVAGSTDALSGLDGYEYETSTDAGASWSTATAGSSLSVSAEGETLIRFRALDVAGNASSWVTGTVRLDRIAPTALAVSRGSLSWTNAASVTVSAAQSTDALSGLAGYESETSTDAGASWSTAIPGSSLAVSAEGETLVRFRAFDLAGNAGSWVSDTVRLDRTPPSPPAVGGGSLSWTSAASATMSATASTDALSGLAGYEFETSTDAGASWSTATPGSSLTVSAEGETLVRFRALDHAGNAGSWVSETVRLDRTLPTAPTVSGGSAAWKSVASITLTPAGAADALSGVASYRFQTSSDAGASWSTATAGSSLTVSAEGETLVRFAAVDGAGNSSSWSAPGFGRLDRTVPSVPSVGGGSPTWMNVASMTVSAAGSTDALSGLAGYESETSTDAGASWSAASPGSSLGISAEGETLVRFRALDLAGNASGWVSDTVRLDRTLPSAPTVSGGSLSWLSQASLTLSGGSSTDTGGSALAGYEYRTSSNGGTTWSGATSGSSLLISAEGQTLVQFRSLDNAGNSSAWAPAAANAGSTARLDRTLPSAPTATTGSSATWKSVASVLLTPTGAADALSGVASYRFQTSSDAGASWSPAASGATLTVSAEGETLVQSAAVDGAGNTSAWSPTATVRLDRTLPTDPSVSGGSLSWTNAASVTISASGSSDSGGSSLSGYQSRTSTNGGTTWSAATAGATRVINTTGQTLVQFRALDNAGNSSAWAPATATAGNTVNIDRTLPSAPTVSGGSLSWLSQASLTLSGGSSTDTGGSALAGYEYRTSSNGGTTWSGATSGSSLLISAEGQTLVQFRSLDNAGNSSAWAPAAANAGSTARLDRTLPSAPTATTGSSATWKSVASVLLTPTGAADALSGVASYRFQTSSDAGASWSPAASGATLTVSAEGETLVQSAAVDGAGNTSAWSPTATVRLDRTLPTDPSVSGGSLSWTNAASVTISASGSSDSGGSSLSGYQSRTSTNGGTTWSAATAGATRVINTTGQTLVQFRALDNAGNSSAWAPATATAGNTVNIDRTLPSAPTVSGGSLSWLSQASLTLSGGSSTDTGGSALAGYEYRTSSNGGTTWSGATSGSSLLISAEGQTLVQFRSLDNAGNSSAWAPAAANAGSTARLDRTLPSAPTATTGSSATWKSVASVLLTPTGAADALSGVASYRFQTSSDAGASWSPAASGATLTVSAEGETLVQSAAVDGAGNTSAWSPTATVRLDRTLPTDPSVSGGSLSWTNAASVTISASGSSDSGGSSLSGYQSRTSTNGGTTWSAATAGATRVINTTGQTLVQFRALDNAGNSSAWAPATATAGNTVNIDRTLPSAPTVSGGSLTCAASRTITGSGSSDAGGSGLAGYDYRVSVDGGLTWGAPQTGASVTFSATGTYRVQFRSRDAAGNVSAWVPAVVGAGNTACIL